MPKHNQNANAPLARLRAASALIPVIESDLATGKMAAERAALMSEFCDWACQSVPEDSDECLALVEAVKKGLVRIKEKLMGKQATPVTD